MSYIGYDPSAPGTISIQRYTAGTDFTAGTTTTLTITSNPGSANNVSIFFDGIAQHHDQWSLSDTTITFTSAIPLGTSVVEIVYGKSVAINVPADGSVTLAKLASDASAALYRRNVLINGSGEYNARSLATPYSGALADDTYGHDRWYRLTQSNAIAVSTVSDAENTTPKMMRLTQSNASAQRMGYAQIVESVNCKHLRGQTVTFKIGRVRLSTSDNIRMAVLEWTGTADTVTSDVVNTWTSTTYTASNFFIGSSVTVSNVTQQSLTANTLTDGTSITVTLGSTFNNLIVFVWTENAVAQNVTLDIGKVQLEKGPSATEYEVLPLPDIIAQCERYYEAGGDGSTTTVDQQFRAAYSGVTIWGVRYRTRKWTNGGAGVTVYAQSSGTANCWREQSTTDVAASVATTTEGGFTTSATTVDANGYAFTWVCDKDL